MRTSLAPAAPLESAIAIPALRRRGAQGKILRHPMVYGRIQPLNLPALLKPLVRAQPEFSPASWIVGAATELAERTGEVVPLSWLEKLARAFRATDVAQLPPGVFAALPKAAWNETSLLGELLLAAREAAARTERVGRAGRASVGCVYTPAAVARAIVAEIHVGARRLVDPACGAGVFLLEAFLRAYHRRLEGGASPIQAARAALSHELTGIDNDAEALAVAEFSLRLAALRLAGLKCDVPLDLRLADALQPLADLEGNCECIAGNPPFIEGRGLSDAQLEELRRRFRCAASGKINLFAVFVERSLALLKNEGVMALVLPATFQRNARYRNLREVLLEHTLESIKPLDAACFGRHVVETVVLRVRKKPPQQNSLVQLAAGPTLQSRLPLGPVLRFCDSIPSARRQQIETMERAGVPLGEHFDVRDGISTGFQPFPQRLLGKLDGADFVALDGTRVAFDPGLHRRIIDGGEFSAFSPIRWAGRYIEYDKRHEHQPPHPGRPFNCQLRDAGIYDRAEKLLTRQTARGLIATVDRDRFFVRNSVHATYPRAAQLLPVAQELSLDALCACLNSALYCDYLVSVTGENGNVFPQVHIADLRQLPIIPDLLGPGGELAARGAELLALHREDPLPQQRIADSIAAIERSLRETFGIR